MHSNSLAQRRCCLYGLLFTWSVPLGRWFCCVPVDGVGLCLHCWHQRAYCSSARWWACTATVEWYWQAKTEELGGKPVQVPQISHGLTQARPRVSAARGWRLTAWFFELWLTVEDRRESRQEVPQPSSRPHVLPRYRTRITCGAGSVRYKYRPKQRQWPGHRGRGWNPNCGKSVLCFLQQRYR
jgi:hypothetical protein